MTVTAAIGRAVETETAGAFAEGIARVVETETAHRMVARVAGTVAWKLEIAQRDGTVEASVTSATSSPASQIAGFRMQWPLNDVGVGSITIPLASSLYAEMVEHRFLHLYLRGARVASCVIGVPTDTLVSRDGDRGKLAEFSLFSLEHLLNEALVYPSRGTDVQPPGEDRIFDWSDPARDNSDFITPQQDGDVTDANSTYPVTPYGSNIAWPGDVGVIGPNGYGWSDDAPSGRCYFYTDAVFSETSYYSIHAAADNALVTLRIDGQEFAGYTWGFVNGVNVDKVLISAGTHRIAVAIENQTAPGAGPTTLALEVVQLDGGGNEGGFEFTTNSADWGIYEFPDHPPGFTIPEIAEVCLSEAQARGAMQHVTAGFLPSHFSDGTAASDTWDVSTKAGTTTVGTFFLKEISETYCDVSVVAGASGGAVWNLYPKGNLGAVVPVTFTKEDFGHLQVERAETGATAFVVRKHDGFHERTTTPVSGHPRVEAGLSLGAQQSDAEADRVTDAQLALFARARAKLTGMPLVGPTTSDAEFPGVAWWVGDTITIPADKDYTATAVRIIAVTIELMDNGHMQPTPEFGDAIVPLDTRPALALGKLAPSLRSRTISQP